MTDKSEIQLQENIPLSDMDLQHIEMQQKVYSKSIPIGLAVCVFLSMGFIALCIKDTFIHLKFYEYFLFVCAGFALYGFCYLIIWSLNSYDNNNWKKDIIHGKNKLTSIIINRDKTEHGEYFFTFAGPLKKDKIRIKVKQAYYYHYQVGTKLTVTYLKYSREVLELIEY